MITMEVVEGLLGVRALAESWPGRGEGSEMSILEDADQVIGLVALLQASLDPAAPKWLFKQLVWQLGGMLDGVIRAATLPADHAHHRADV